MRTCFRLSAAVLLTLALLPLGTRVARSQTAWNWSNPRPQGNDLYGVSVRKDSLVYAVGDFGTIVRRVHGTLQSPVYYGTKRMECAASYVDSVWIASDSGSVYRSLDDGITWTSVSTNYPWISYHGIAVANKRNLIVVGDSGYVVYSSNSGNSWTRETNISSQKLNCVRIDSLTAYAVGAHGTFLRGNEYGLFGWGSSSLVESQNLNGVYFDTNYVFIAGDSGRVIQFDPHANAPVYDTTVGTHSLYDIWYSNPYVVAVGAAGTIITSSDNGGTWTMVNSGVTTDLLRLDSTAGQFGTLVAVGRNGVILRSTNDGYTWTRLDSGSHAIVYALTASPNHSYYGTSNSGAIYVSSNAGSTWVRDTITSAYNSLSDIQFQPNGFGLIAPVGAAVLVSLDSGKTWSAKTISGATIEGIASTLDSIGLAVGGAGVIYRSSNKGSTWTAMTSGTHNTLYDVDCYGTRAIAVGYNGTFVYSTDAGLTWSTGSSSSTAQLNRVRFATSTLAVAVGVVGNIWRTTNGGANWSNVSTSLTGTMRDIVWHDNVDGMVVGDAGTILRTNNGGTSWVQDVSRTSSDLYAGLITSGTSAFAAGNNGVILVTSNSELPVELVRLDAERTGQNSVRLDWETASESNVAEFQVDRLSDDWTLAGALPISNQAAGGSSDFSLVDQSALSSATTYRLSEVDLDGSVHLLGEVEVGAWGGTSAAPSVELWPNPATDAVQIGYQLAAQSDVRVTVYDVLGKVVIEQSFTSQSAGSHTLPFSVSQLTNGVYRAVVEYGSERIVAPLSIVR